MEEKTDVDQQPTPAAEFHEIMKQLEGPATELKRPTREQTGEVATKSFFSDLRKLRDGEISL